MPNDPGWSARDVVSVVSATLAAVGLFIAAMTFRRNARNTMLATFNSVRQQIEQLGRALQGRPPAERENSAELKGLLNELEWLATLVHEADIKWEVFARYYAPVFLIYSDRHKPDIERIRKQEANAYAEIEWLTKEIRDRAAAQTK